jgi:valyl-tRNA synthetase
MTDAQSAQNIATTYDPTEIEKKWYQIWEQKVISNHQVKVNHSVS